MLFILKVFFNLNINSRSPAPNLNKRIPLNKISKILNYNEKILKHEISKLNCPIMPLLSGSDSKILLMNDQLNNVLLIFSGCESYCSQLSFILFN